LTYFEIGDIKKDVALKYFEKCGIIAEEKPTSAQLRLSDQIYEFTGGRLNFLNDAVYDIQKGDSIDAIKKKNYNDSN